MSLLSDSKERSRFYADLATSLDAGLPVLRALRLAAERRGRFGMIAGAAATAIGDGSSFTEGLAGGAGSTSL